MSWHLIATQEMHVIAPVAKSRFLDSYRPGINSAAVMTLFALIAAQESETGC